MNNITGLKPRSGPYNTYWYFAAERQNAFYKKIKGDQPPYSDDLILQQYKFCNVYRACDRVSQYLIKTVIYDKPYSDLDTLFRIFLFRLLNKTKTWSLLEEELGEIHLANFSYKTYASAIEKLKSRGEVIYGNAFILCASKAFGHHQKHQNQLALLEMVFRGDKSLELLKAKSLKELFLALRDLPLIGDFMAYQIAIDFNYSPVFSFDENDFTIAGPGSKRGIQKCFENASRYSYEDIIMHMVHNQEKEFARLGLNFQDLGGRKLKAIDCQGLFCETDKYCRVKFPELLSNRTRIKAKYQPNNMLIEYYFPPKWDIKAID